jgi:hypothetical protein
MRFLIFCSRVLYYIILPLSLIFLALTIGSWYLTMTRIMARSEIAATQAKAPQETYKDVLTTVLTLSGIAITLAGFGIYRFISQQVNERVSRSVEARFTLAFLLPKVELAYTLWELSNEAESAHLTNLARKCLDSAIQNSQEVHDDTSKFYEEVRRRKTSFDGNIYGGIIMEDIIYRLADAKNNLAYYISKKALQGRTSVSENRLALNLICYLEQNWHKYPRRSNDYRDTIEQVRQRIPS